MRYLESFIDRTWQVVSGALMKSFWLISSFK